MSLINNNPYDEQFDQEPPKKNINKNNDSKKVNPENNKAVCFINKTFELVVF